VKLVVGLGNPGRRYAATRHNVGFRIVERFAERRGLDLGEGRFGGRFGRGHVSADGVTLDVAVLEPQTYMNRSGDSVAEALRFLPLESPAEDLYVVVDDVDLPFGRLRLRPSGGGAGHRGLSNVIERLGTTEFPRLRFGVGRPPDTQETADYVLQAFDADERVQLAGRVDAAVEALEAALVDGVSAAMNRFNRPPELESG